MTHIDGAGERGDQAPPGANGSPGEPAGPPAPPAKMVRPDVPERGPLTASEVAAAGHKPGLRLVATRPMWDAGVLVQHSPSLSGLHPPLRLALNPDDLGNLGAEPGGSVRVSTQRGSLVMPVAEDPGVAPGTAVIPFNLPGGGAGSLIDASAAFTELSVEGVGAP